MQNETDEQIFHSLLLEVIFSYNMILHGLETGKVKVDKRAIDGLANVVSVLRPVVNKIQTRQ